MATTRPAICAFTSGWVKPRRWTLSRSAGPPASVDTLKDLDVNRLYVVEEGGKILKNEALVPATKKH